MTSTPRRRRMKKWVKILLIVSILSIVVGILFLVKGCSNDTTDATPIITTCQTCGLLECECEATELSKLKVEIEALKAENEVLKTDNEALKAANEVLKTDNEALKAANEVLKTENEALKALSIPTTDDTALADAKAEAASWKGKYEQLYKTHQSCEATTVDLTQYVSKKDHTELTDKYNKLVSEYSAFKGSHTNCVAKSTYDAKVAELNKLKSHKCDHNSCIAKSTYDSAVTELNKLKSHKCDHNSCVPVSEYSSLKAKYNVALDTLSSHKACISVSDYNTLNSKYQTALKELNTWKAHKCTSGTTVIQADHSNCVSLKDYNELLKAYNTLLNK